VTEPETGPRTNDEADEARVKKWVGKVGGVTLPLLAGFSFTSVIVVSSDDAEHFLLTGLTILTLVVFRAGPGCCSTRWRRRPPMVCSLPGLARMSWRSRMDLAG
jgi:hypothetical protein